ncbi:MAG TPA: extracellular solute-binding protein [Roseiflexaceae bacterium]|nr:extracellular solute-binding protein [Roseiflexaceae bacterium]HMP40262.1 extracellular solute-binding protein [Roseiflexaceae bacterium]
MKINPARSPLTRRAFLRMLATAGGGALLGACGLAAPVPPTATPQPVAITIWNWLDDALTTLIADFEAQQSAVTVRAERMGYEAAHRQLLQALERGSGAPDVFITDRGMLGVLREQPGLADLAAAPFDGLRFKADLLGWAWDAASFEGRLTAMPWNVGVGAAWYRADTLAAAGLPTEPAALAAQAQRWDDWQSLDQELRRQRPGSELIAESLRLFAPAVAQQGGGWFDGGRLRVAERAGPAAELIAGLARRDIPADLPGSQYGPRMVDGTIAGFIDASWMQLFIQRDFPTTAGQWRLIRPPGGDFSLSSLAMLIPAQSQQQEAAWQFVTTLCTTVAAQNLTFQSSGALPAYMPAWNDPIYDQGVPFFGDQPAYRVLVEAAAAQPSITLSRYDTQIDAIVGMAAGRIARGTEEPAAALAAAEEQIRRQFPDLAA